MSIMIFDDEYFMREALKEARKAYDDDEVPVGAVVVCNNRIIGRGHNMTERLHDVTAHAEMIAITAASEHLGSKYLNDCRLFVTLEPCTMCAGAIGWAQLGEIVYGAADEKRGFMLLQGQILHPRTVLRYGVMAGECRALLQDFFKQKR